MTKAPQIAVVTATYNAAKTIEGLMASLRDQTDNDFEWCVADGESRDGTREIVEAERTLNVRFNSQADFGCYDGMNRAVRMATAEYYVVCGADDVLAPDAIKEFRTAIQQSRADIIAAKIQMGDRILSVRNVPRLVASQFAYIAGHSVGTAIRKSLHDRCGYYSKRFPIAADQHFILKAVSQGATVHRASFVAGAYGIEGQSSMDVLGSLTEQYRIDVELFRRPVISTFLVGARLLRHWTRAMRVTRS